MKLSVNEKIYHKQVKKHKYKWVGLSARETRGLDSAIRLKRKVSALSPQNWENRQIMLLPGVPGVPGVPSVRTVSTKLGKSCCYRVTRWETCDLQILRLLTSHTITSAHPAVAEFALFSSSREKYHYHYPGTWEGSRIDSGQVNFGPFHICWAFSLICIFM